MISDLEIYGAANMLIERHGADALNRGGPDGLTAC
jgi:hypothetical protein